MLALSLMLLVTYHALNYAGIKGLGLLASCIKIALLFSIYPPITSDLFKITDFLPHTEFTRESSC